MVNLYNGVTPQTALRIERNTTVYVLQDNSFQPVRRISSWEERADASRRAKLVHTGAHKYLQCANLLVAVRCNASRRHNINTWGALSTRILDDGAEYPMTPSRGLVQSYMRSFARANEKL
jgi:hypothetical protein